MRTRRISLRVSQFEARGVVCCYAVIVSSSQWNTVANPKTNLLHCCRVGDMSELYMVSQTVRIQASYATQASELSIRGRIRCNTRAADSHVQASP